MVSGYLLLPIKETGLQHILDKLAAENPVHVGRDGAPANRLRKASTNNIMFQPDIERLVFRVLGNKLLYLTKEIGQPRVEHEFLPEFAQQAIVQALEKPRLHVGENMVQIARIGIDGYALLRIAGLERVHFGPELLAVHTVMAEQRILHIGTDKRLVAVPDHRDDILFKGSLFHISFHTN